MPKKYESIYVGLAELVMELGDRNTYEEKGRFIDEVVRCIVRQKRGVNSYADSLMDQADGFREESRRRQQEYRDRKKEAEAKQEAEPEKDEVPNEKTTEHPVIPAKPAKRAREKKADAIDDPEKNAYGQFSNVYLTDAELKNLKNKYAEKWDHALDILSSYKKSSGKTYKSDFAAFFAWVDKRLAEENGAAKSGRSFRQIDKADAAKMAREEFPGVMEAFQL